MDKIVELIREMSKNGDMTWISAHDGVPRVVKQRDLHAFLAAADAIRERKQEAVYG
jgi:hypothetical protein